MTIREFPYKLIAPNPWQTRIEEDPAHIQSLRESIRKNGLLQIPKGRFASAEIQLAFGHSRLRAWHAEFPDKPFPVDVQDLTNRQMADYAIEENERRHELSPIERMRAIRHYMESFKVRELEAGAPFGYKTQSAVANILRLGNLPEKTQELVHRGQLPERYARALVAFSKMDPKGVEEAAVKISKAEEEDDRSYELEDFTGEFLNKHGVRLEYNGWPMDWPKKPIPAPYRIDTPTGVQSFIKPCAGCSWLFDRVGFSNYCLRPDCFNAKMIVWKNKQEKKNKKIISKPKKEKPDPKIAYAAEADRLIAAAVPSIAQAIPHHLVEFLLGTLMWYERNQKKNKNYLEKQKAIVENILDELIPHARYEVKKPAETIKRIQTIARSVRVKLPKGWNTAPAGEPKKRIDQKRGKK